MDLSGYKLTFSEEFNDRSISQTGEGTTWADIRSEWRLDANSDIGFGHSSFVDAASGYDPFKVENGILSITAVPDRTDAGYPGSWESGLIHTKNSFSQTYGYFEMRADFADASGSWDAFWMLPMTHKDPNNTGKWQELDIVEHYGDGAESTYRWIHTTDPTKDANVERQVTTWNPEQTSGYHTYGMDWQKDKISFYFDGEYMGSQPTPSDMHDPMYILANLATQDSADNAGVPITTKIDYIRAYSNDPAAVETDAGGVAPAPLPPVAEAAPPSGQENTPSPVSEASPPPAEPVEPAQPTDVATQGPEVPAPPVPGSSSEEIPSATGGLPASETPAAAPVDVAPAGAPQPQTPVAMPSAAEQPAQGEDSALGAAPPVVEPAPSATQAPAQTETAGGLDAAPVVETPAPLAEAPAPTVAAPEMPVQPTHAGGSGEFDALLSLFNSAAEGSFKYVYCAASGPAADLMQRGGDASAALGDFLEGRGFGAFRSEGSSSATADLLASGNLGSASRYDGGGAEPGTLVGHLAMDDTTHVPVFVDHWTV